MTYLNPDIEKRNTVVPFRTWDGHMAIAVPCGGWRRARPLDIALMASVARHVVIIRDREG